MSPIRDRFGQGWNIFKDQIYFGLILQFIICLEADVRNTKNYNEKTKFVTEGIK
jgi:hypothetical protein